MSDQPRYQVGAVVNGHQWTGQAWVPAVAGPVVGGPDAGGGAGQVPQQVQVGQVVNGYRWNGQMWVSEEFIAAADRRNRANRPWVVAGIAAIGVVGLVVSVTVATAFVSRVRTTTPRTAFEAQQPAGEGQALGSSPHVAYHDEFSLMVMSSDDVGHRLVAEGSESEADGRFFRVIIRVENATKDSNDVLHSHFSLVDDAGRSMAPVWQTATARSGALLVQHFNRGEEKDVTLFFDLPNGAVADHVVFNPGPPGTPVQVAVRD